MLRHHAQLDLADADQWLLPDLIPSQGLVVIASAPKTGKTVLVNAIARAMATGGEFAGVRYEDKIPVAWCAHEETIGERASLMAGLTSDALYYLAMPPELPYLDDMHCDYEVDRYGRYQGLQTPYAFAEAAKIGAGLLVIDCLHAAVRHSNLADNQVARRIMGKLRHWSNAFGIATVVLHHLTKSAHRGYHPERFADSAQILAAASTYFFMESELLEDGTRKIVLSGAGRRPAPPPRQAFIAHSLFDYRWVKPSQPAERPPSLTERVSELLAQGWELTAEQIANRIDANVRSVRNVLTGLPGIERVDPSTRKARYRLVITSPPSRGADDDDEPILLPESA